MSIRLEAISDILMTQAVRRGVTRPLRLPRSKA
jgi:hypothetical protein